MEIVQKTPKFPRSYKNALYDCLATPTSRATHSRAALRLTYLPDQFEALENLISASRNRTNSMSSGKQCNASECSLTQSQ